jgi:hypothetical protein
MKPTEARRHRSRSRSRRRPGCVVDPAALIRRTVRSRSRSGRLRCPLVTGLRPRLFQKSGGRASSSRENRGTSAVLLRSRGQHAADLSTGGRALDRADDLAVDAQVSSELDSETARDLEPPIAGLEHPQAIQTLLGGHEHFAVSDQQKVTVADIDAGRSTDVRRASLRLLPGPLRPTGAKRNSAALRRGSPPSPGSVIAVARLMIRSWHSTHSSITCRSQPRRGARRRQELSTDSCWA